MNFLSGQFMNTTLSGITDGLIYGLIALSLVLAWRATRVLNFAQGAMGMFTTFIAVELLENSIGFWWALVVAVVAGMVIGGGVERALIRPLHGKSEINPIVVTVGLLVVLESLAAMIWSATPRNFPNPFSQVGYSVGGQTINFAPSDLLTLVSAAIITVGMFALFQFTNFGLKMRAAALAPEVARLLGVRVSRMLTFGWMLAGGVGSVAGILVAAQNATGITPTTMELPFVFAFIAAAIGGLDSPLGAVVGGLFTGLLLQYVTAYWNQDLAPAVLLVALMVVLMVRPEGLFQRAAARRV